MEPLEYVSNQRSYINDGSSRDAIHFMNMMALIWTGIVVGFIIVGGIFYFYKG